MWQFDSALRSLNVTHDDVKSFGGTVRIQSDHAADPTAPYEIVKTMRASISVLGPLSRPGTLPSPARGCFRGSAGRPAPAFVRWMQD